MTATDRSGNPLAKGTRVTALRDGVPYTGTVQDIFTYPDCESQHRHLTVRRDGDSAVMHTTSDAVTVT